MEDDGRRLSTALTRKGTGWQRLWRGVRQGRRRAARVQRDAVRGGLVAEMVHGDKDIELR